MKETSFKDEFTKIGGALDALYALEDTDCPALLREIPLRNEEGRSDIMASFILRNSLAVDHILDISQFLAASTEGIGVTAIERIRLDPDAFPGAFALSGVKMIGPDDGKVDNDWTPFIDVDEDGVRFVCQHWNTGESYCSRHFTRPEFRQIMDKETSLAEFSRIVDDIGRELVPEM